MKHCIFDEQGLDAYVARMKQMNVAEADMISMVDYKGHLLQIANKLRKPIFQVIQNNY